MKLPLQQLESHLSKNLAPIYLISSDELLLAQEAAALVRDAAQKAGFTERTLISDTDWGKSLYSSTHSLSLFAPKQLIELNLHGTKFGATTTKALQEYAEKPSADTLLLIRTDKVDGKTEKSAWFQTLEKHCVFIAIWPLPAAQLPQWILQRAKKIGLTLSKDTADLIAHQAEGNLLAAAQEIEKLSLLNSATDANNAISDNAHFTVFDLVDSVLCGHHARSLRILKNLEAEDTEPPLVLWALTREFRMLADMYKQLKQGISFATLFNKFRIFEKRQMSVRSFLQRHNEQYCWDLLLKAAHIDRLIKGAAVGNVWDEIANISLLPERFLRMGEGRG